MPGHSLVTEPRPAKRRAPPDRLGRAQGAAAQEYLVVVRPLADQGDLAKVRTGTAIRTTGNRLRCEIVEDADGVEQYIERSK